MKYDSGEDYGDVKKVYRDCVLVDKKYFSINANYPDEIIDINNPPKGYFVCDKLIAPIICRLNAKGYETLFSCQGHIDHIEGYDRPSLNLPYVMFKVGKHFDRYYKYLFKLPKQFEVEISSDIDDVEEAVKDTYFYHNIDKMEDRRITIRSNAIYSYTDQYGDNNLTDEIFNKFNNIDIADLMDWVEQLPDLTIEFSNCLYSERIIDRETARQCGFDFESVQEYAADIEKSYDMLVGAMKDMYESMSVAMDTYKYIGMKLQSLKLVDDIKSIDGEEVIDYSKLSPTEHLELFKEVHKLNEQKENINKIKKSFKEEAKSTLGQPIAITNEELRELMKNLDKK